MCLPVSTIDLPHAAFVPRRVLGDTDRYEFVMRRNRLFAVCTPEERRQLVILAQWYEAHDPRLLREPNVFRQARTAVARYHVMHLASLVFGQPMRPPGLVERALAKVSDGIDAIEAYRGRRMQKGFVAELEGLLRRGDADVVFGVLHFLRSLRIHPGTDLRPDPPFTQQLERLADASAEDTRVPAARRFAAVQRCALWPRDGMGPLHEAPDLHLHVWRQLLALLEEDVPRALGLVDRHWGRRESPALLSKMSLLDDPPLACRLALALRPHRPDVAADLLGESIHAASYQWRRLSPDGPAQEALQSVMDASCVRLADWALDEGLLRVDVALAALRMLFRHGDPTQSYWHRLPGRSMVLLGELPAPEQHRPVPTLVCVAFYTPPADPLGTRALERLEAIARGLMAAPERRLLERPSPLTDFFSDTLGVQEDALLSGRNRRVPAQPDHPLRHTVDRLVDDLMARIVVAMPQHALACRVALIYGLSGEVLIRKHHRLLRETFEPSARAHPQEAGAALKRIAQYVGFSQVEDEMYKPQLCSESFDQLIPVLESISPPDAAVAREGVGWSPSRGRD